MEIVSHCPLLVTSRPYRTARGARFVLVVCKGTFLLTPGTATFGGTQEPIFDEDKRWDDKPDRSLFAASDIVPFKRDVDVVLVGHAFAPGGHAVRSIVTRLCVGEVDKCIEVFADRIYTPHGELRDGPKITRARLRYERAVGGPGTSNPVGMRHDKKDLFGAIPLASLQPPGLHVTRPEELLEPIGYGPIAPEWPMRASRLAHWAGSFSPTHWLDAPLPDDLDPSVFNVAPLDQRLREVRPDERIVLEGLTSDQARFVTQLPGLSPYAVVERAGGRRDPLPLRADTLAIDTSRRVCTLTWRASVPLVHPTDTGRVVVTIGAPETSRVFARHDPALLATPMGSSDLERGGTISVNLHGQKRPVTPFEPSAISAPDTLELLPDDAAFIEDEETFVQTDDVKSNTLPFVGSQNNASERPSNVPAPAFDKALPFAAPIRAPSSPGLPFVPPAAPPPRPPAPSTPPQAPSRDLPFFSPHSSSSQSDSRVFPAPPVAPKPPIALAPPPPVPVAPPAPVPSREFPFASSVGSSNQTESQVFARPNLVPPPPVFPAPPPVAIPSPLAITSPPKPLGMTLQPAPPSVPTTPPEIKNDTPPPMIGPLATPEMVARGAQTPSEEEKTAPIAASTTTPTSPVVDDDSIERCARVTASIARRKEERAKILDAEKLDADRFSAMQTKWTTAISAETDKGKTKLLEKFDDAYVGRLEEERGVIRPEEFARIVVSAERGHPDVVMRELGLPPSALMRVERVFLRRTSRDQDLAQRVLRAIDSERDA